MINKILRNWKTIIFNVSETVIIIILGFALKLNIKDIVTVILLFGLTRCITKEGLHYKSWKKCLFWSTTLLFSLFVLVRVDIRIDIFMTIFSAVITSKKADVKDWSMYRNNPKERKYRELEYYIAKNKKSKELKKFEEILIDLNKTYMERYKVNLYEVYKLYFLEGKSFGEIIKITDIYDNHGVTKALDIIFFSFNTYIVTIGEKEQLNLEELTYNS